MTQEERDIAEAMRELDAEFPGLRNPYPPLEKTGAQNMNRSRPFFLSKCQNSRIEKGA